METRTSVLASAIWWGLDRRSRRPDSLDGTTAAGWRSVQAKTQLGIPGTYTFVHSVDGFTGYFSRSSTVFIVELATGRQIDIRYRDDRDPLVTHTANGIWYNIRGSYTIAGGSGEVLNPASGKVEVGAACLINYYSISNRFSNHTTFLPQPQKL